jgi:hypothetical protein
MFTQFQTLSPVTFYRRLGTGRSKPLIVECVNPTTEDKQVCVLKPTASMELGVKVVMTEYLGYQLAVALGMPVPAPCIIDIPIDFAQSIPDPGTRQLLEQSVGLNFGTVMKTQGYTTYPIDKPIPTEIFLATVDAFAFDVLLQNPDRTKKNPNLLANEGEIVLLDLELAFSFVDDILARRAPADSLVAAKLTYMQDHVFYSGLRRKPINLNRFVGALGAIAPADIDGLRGLIPTPWRTGDVDPILQYLDHMVRNPNRIEQVVRELLA